MVIFGHSGWSFLDIVGGHFCQKSGRKIISIINNLKKKGKNLGWVKNTITEKLKERVFNKILIRMEYIKHNNLNKSFKSIEMNNQIEGIAAVLYNRGSI